MHAVVRVAQHAGSCDKLRYLSLREQKCQCDRANGFDYYATFLTLRSERKAVMRAGKRILVVDDSKPMTAFVANILKEANYENIERVHDCASALALLRKGEYDLIIIDEQMQPISGSELTKLIRADKLKVKIILIGLHGEDDKAWLDGADAYVTKPVEPRDLKEKVEDVLSRVAQLASG
jgi:CheY-like chemotaxis protein